MAARECDDITPYHPAPVAGRTGPEHFTRNAQMVFRRPDHTAPSGCAHKLRNRAEHTAARFLQVALYLCLNFLSRRRTPLRRR